MRTKMSLDDLKSFYKPVMIVEGNPDTLTGATRKNHIHVVNPSAKPSKGLSSHAQARKDAKAVLLSGGEAKQFIHDLLGDK